MQYLPEPVGDFMEPLTEEELDKHRTSLINIVAFLAPWEMTDVAKEHLQVDVEVLTTLRDSVNMAATLGVAPVDYFAEQYARGILGEEGDLGEEQLQEGRELFSNMVNVFNEAILSSEGEVVDRLSDRVKTLRIRTEEVIRALHVATREQQKYLGEEAEHYNAFILQDDVGLDDRP